MAALVLGLADLLYAGTDIPFGMMLCRPARSRLPRWQHVAAHQSWVVSRSARPLQQPRYHRFTPRGRLKAREQIRLGEGS